MKPAPAGLSLSTTSPFPYSQPEGPLFGLRCPVGYWHRRAVGLSPWHPSQVRMDHPAQASPESGNVQVRKENCSVYREKAPGTERVTRWCRRDDSTFIPWRDLLFSASLIYYAEDTSVGIALMLGFFSTALGF